MPDSEYDQQTRQQVDETDSAGVEYAFARRSSSKVLEKARGALSIK
jgi:hypothetical protein